MIYIYIYKLQRCNILQSVYLFIYECLVFRLALAPTVGTGLLKHLLVVAVADQVESLDEAGATPAGQGALGVMMLQRQTADCHHAGRHQQGRHLVQTCHLHTSTVSAKLHS